MKAVGYKEQGEITRPDALVDIEIEQPVARGKDILVEVKAISVNPVDTKVRKRAAAEARTVENFRLGCSWRCGQCRRRSHRI